MTDTQGMAEIVSSTMQRRRYPRRRFQRSIGFLIEGVYVMGLGREIGEGGMALVLPQGFEIEKEAVVSFQIPEGHFISVRVEIRSSVLEARSGQYMVGCQFKNLNFDQKRDIRAYVSARTEFEN